MTKSKYDWQLNYRRLITEKPYMMFFLGLVFTIFFGMGLKGLSQNPEDNSKTEKEVREEVINLCASFPIYKNL